MVHGPPQVLSSTVERDEDFIQIPGVAQPTSAAPQLSCVVETERLTPVTDGFVRNCDASLGEQIFHITATQAEAVSRPGELHPHAACDWPSAIRHSRSVRGSTTSHHAIGAGRCEARGWRSAYFSQPILEGDRSLFSPVLSPPVARQRKVRET